LATVWATFPKIWANFLPIIWSPCFHGSATTAFRTLVILFEEKPALKWTYGLTADKTVFWLKKFIG
jgi:hypothetical protein